MSTDVRIDWTLVVNFDNHGTLWGVDSIENTDDMIDRERANGLTIHEWFIADPAGLPIRIVRILDPEFLDTISVFPAECPDCDAPVTTTARVSEEHRTMCPHRDPNF
ncbi:hypothetical protein [Streptomyces sp. NPDC005731]|uniref:hypothetical protein n=1 Tax=Streptomyces sp. NPDC005731 TaxID=3157056 RepID=UPI0033DC8A7D